jgi:hypothetical protein
MFASFRWTKSPRKPNLPIATAFRLRLEQLEDRCVPSVNPIVTTPADSGDGSLRDAIQQVNMDSSTDSDTIQFASSLSAQTIVLSSALPQITHDVSIIGLGAGQLAVSGNDSVQVFSIGSSITVSLSDLSIINGNSGDNGGGISNFGSLTVSNTTFSGNSANAEGGGINNLGTLTVSNSTLSGNSTNNGIGGGIYNVATLTLSNSTLSANSATNAGGGIFNSGAATGENNIIAKNTAVSSDPDLHGAFTSQGHNLIGDVGSATGFTATDQVGISANPIDPKLGPLQDNGGLTLTMALLPGSPAMDAGDDSVLGPPLNLTTDQRGQPRKEGAHVDIGAFEATSVSISPTSLTWDDVYGGVNYSYQISGEALTQDTEIALYWSRSANFADRIGGPIPGTENPIPAGTSVGSHPPVRVKDGVIENDDPLNFGDVPDGAAYLLVVADPNNALGNFTEANNVVARANPLFVPLGQFTFNVEGKDNSAIPSTYSRHIYWPGGDSGVTLGRGYDMGRRTRCAVYEDLINACIAPDQAATISAGAGLHGPPAQQFVNEHKASIGDITREQQQALFNIDYPRYITGDRSRGLKGAETKYTEVTKRFSDAVPWEQLSAPIRAILVDLNYNEGHLDPAAVQAAMTNDYSLLIRYLDKRLSSLDPLKSPALVLRFRQRIAYLKEFE